MDFIISHVSKSRYSGGANFRSSYLSPDKQFRIGECLRELGEEDILVIGSGVTVHNLRMIHWGQSAPEPWAIAFDDWLIDKVEKKETWSRFSTMKSLLRMPVRLCPDRSISFRFFYCDGQWKSAKHTEGHSSKL